MQQSLTKATAYEEYSPRRAHRPVLMKRAQLIFVFALLVLDIGCTWLAFYLAHGLMVRDPDIIIGPFMEFWLLPAVYTVVLVIIFFTQRMYQRRRAISYLDEFFKLVSFNSFAILITVALITLALRDFRYHRQFLFYAWAINIGLLTLARSLHAQVQWQAQARGIGDDRVLIIGAGEVGQMLVQKVLQNPKLGYQVVGVVDNGKTSAIATLLGLPTWAHWSISLGSSKNMRLMK